jgi:Ca-activated chloride channel family protein
MRAIKVCLLLGTLGAGAPTATSQQSPNPSAIETPQALFKSRADLVVLYVNVFDGRSDAVPSLPQNAFRVIEDGKPREITFFSDVDVPVAVGLAVDNSTSMMRRRQMVVAGATAFSASSHPEDELFTLVFNEHVRLGLPDGIAFTQTPSLLQSALTRFPIGGMTALYDAVIGGLDHLQQATHQKRVLIVLSDGEDNASRHSEADMLHRARRNDALIYTVWTGDLTSTRGDRAVLRQLASLSGGVAYAPRTEQDVVGAFTAIAENIRRGYSIGYVPANPEADGEYRRVQVLVQMAGQRLTVRARNGYTASLPSDSH